MSDLWRIHDEPEAVKRPDGAFYSEKGWLVPVEPVGTLTVDDLNIDYYADLGLPLGEYLIVPKGADGE